MKIKHYCHECGDEVAKGRWDLGYKTCLFCGEEQARMVRFTIAIPYSKGAYQLIHDPKDLFNTNPKRTT